MAIKYLGNGKLVGLSTDTKPTTYPAGVTFFETDTGVTFTYSPSYNPGNWSSLDFPTPRKIWGVRLGFNANGNNANFGTGLLFGTVTANGTGAAVAPGTDSTDGNRVNNATGTNNTFARAGWWSPNQIMRKYNPSFTVRFRLGRGTNKFKRYALYWIYQCVSGAGSRNFYAFNNARYKDRCSFRI